MPWNAGEVLAIEYLKEHFTEGEIGIYNDRFGFASLLLHDQSVTSILDYKSQEKAIKHNYSINDLELKANLIYGYSEALNHNLDFILMKMPKSMDRFQLMLSHAHKNVSKDGKVVISFMTKYFTASMLDIAELYFEEVEQSRAFKKSRLLILEKPRHIEDTHLLNEIDFDDKLYQQYLGVFSAKHIDYATQFLLEKLNVLPTDKKVLDLASGNGVIADYVHRHYNIEQVKLIDDDILAIDSSKLNCLGEPFDFIHDNSLDSIDDDSLDFVVSNPPFHFDHENNIEVSIDLFKQVKSKLKTDGHFQLVANKHLNYKTHLDKIYSRIEVSAQNDKFVVYDCFV